MIKKLQRYMQRCDFFAKHKKAFIPRTGKCRFQFSDTYAPVDFSGARACEIRVWAFFNA